MKATLEATLNRVHPTPCNLNAFISIFPLSFRAYFTKIDVPNIILVLTVNGYETVTMTLQT